MAFPKFSSVANLPKTMTVGGRTLKFLLADSPRDAKTRKKALRDAGWKYITYRKFYSPRYGEQLATYADGRDKIGKWWL